VDLAWVAGGAAAARRPREPGCGVRGIWDQRTSAQIRAVCLPVPALAAATARTVTARRPT
jgi:hypothetical protein